MPFHIWETLAWNKGALTSIFPLQNLTTQFCRFHKAFSITAAYIIGQPQIWKANTTDVLGRVFHLITFWKSITFCRFPLERMNPKEASSRFHYNTIAFERTKPYYTKPVSSHGQFKPCFTITVTARSSIATTPLFHVTQMPTTQTPRSRSIKVGEGRSRNNIINLHVFQIKLKYRA